MRLRRWGLTFGALYSLFIPHSFNFYTQVRYLITWEAVEHEGPYVSVFPSRVPGALKTRIYIGIYDTCYLSHLCAVLSLSPGVLCPHGLRRTAPGRRGTPAGPASPHGLLSRKALTSVRSCCRRNLPPCAGVLPRRSRRNN